MGMAKSTQVTRSAESDKSLQSKEAKRFQSLMEQIRKKEMKLEEMKQRLDQNLDEYLSQVKPLAEEWTKMRIRKLIALSQYMQAVAMSASNLQTLVNYFYEECEDIDELGILLDPESTMLEEELKHIERFLIRKNGGVPEEQAGNEKAERAAAIEESKKYFIQKLKEAGVELSLDEIHEGLSDEEINIRMQRLVEDALKRAGHAEEMNHASGRKKSKKQLEKEAAIKAFEEDKDNSLSGLYKKLAKLLHPDTATDDKSKEEKLQWMQKLTVAYQAKDLKTMLMIELEWLNVESHKIESLSETHLAYYNSFLSKQASELQQQIESLPHELRYRSMSYFLEEPDRYKSWKVVPILYDVLESIALDRDLFDGLKSGPSRQKATIKAIIEEQRDLEKTRSILDSLYGDW